VESLSAHERAERRMYVCVCNAVTEDDVRSCMASGLCAPKEVKAACGMKPGCGSCTKRLYALMSEIRTAGELVDAITGGPASPVMSADPRDPLAAPPCVRQGPVPVAGTTLPVRTSAERGSASPTAA
jgi:bacterioferritin-associated ferredoxin